MANLKIENFTSNDFTEYLDSYGYDINVPFDLKQHCKLNIDPALASSVFVTTITDVIGFLSFLGIGSYFFLN